MDEEFLAKYGREYVQLKEAELRLKKQLPHLYGLKFYTWARDFFESKSKLNFLSAGNQLGKSSFQIRKCIHWATATNLWPELWPGYRPDQFWYLYPTSNQATIEFEKKWKQYLPGQEYRDHPEFGWREEKKNKEIFAVHFNSGVSVYFKTYKQGLVALQTGTVHAVFLDEECPESLWDELAFRVNAVNGYIHMVFTATLGQEIWRLTLEPKEGEEEKFPGAWKRQVSLYDCKVYEDGTLSHWSEERIKRVIASCKDQKEVLRRVFGKFIKEESGLKYPQFDATRHLVASGPVPEDWLWYSCVDMGSGGSSNHPSAIAFVAVSPDLKQGRVVTSWRGDGISTDSSYVLTKHNEMRTNLGCKPVMQIYDYSSAEFGLVAAGRGESFVRADKSHEKGEQIVNTLFRNDMLLVDENEASDNGKLVAELSTVSNSTAKRNRLDDLSDTVRYICTLVPWNWSDLGKSLAEIVVNADKVVVEQKILGDFARHVNERRRMHMERREENGLDQEFQEWNEQYES